MSGNNGGLGSSAAVNAAGARAAASTAAAKTASARAALPTGLVGVGKAKSSGSYVGNSGKNTVGLEKDGKTYDEGRSNKAGGDAVNSKVRTALYGFQKGPEKIGTP